MKTYLNRQEKEDYVMLAATQVAADGIIQRWGDHDNLTTQERARLRTAVTHIKQTMSAIANRLAPDQRMALVRVAKGTHCICVPNERQTTFNKRMEQEENTEKVLVLKDTLDALAEMAIDKCCCPCLHAEDKENCPCRLAFLELDIPVYDENPNEGVCPWEIVTEVSVDNETHIARFSA